MVMPVTRVIVHDKPGNCTPWGHHGTPGWYIGPSLDQYTLMQCYMPATGILHITYTLQYITKAFAFPKTIAEYYLQQYIGDILEIIQDPPKTLPLLYCIYVTKDAISQVAHILQESTALSCLQILPFPPMLPQSQTQDPSPVIVTHQSAPAPRLEPFVQPPKVKTHMTAPTSPLRVQHTTSPSSDPFTNP